MNLRVVLVEDEPLGLQRLRKFVRSDPEVEIVAECVEGESALQQILELSPDVVFLDVQLPGMTGLEVLNGLQQMRPPVIIFTTAFEQFAVQAFERGAVDYLLKPFDQDRVRRALERARVLLRSPLSSDHAAKTIKQLLEKSAGSSGSVRRLAIKSERRISFVETSDIDWVGAADNYVEIHVGKSTHLLRVTLSELEHQLSANRFVRISRSSLINVDKILEIRSKPHGDYEIQLRGGNVLSGSRKFRARLQQLMTASQ